MLASCMIRAEIVQNTSEKIYKFTESPPYCLLVPGYSVRNTKIFAGDYHYGGRANLLFLLRRSLSRYHDLPKRTFVDTETDSLSTETDSLGTGTDRNGLSWIYTYQNFVSHNFNSYSSMDLASLRETLPPNYRFVARKDRLKDAHGGVAIIARSDMDCVEIDVQTSTEFVAASFPCTSLKKPIIVGSLYRPLYSDVSYTDQLFQAIKDLSIRHKESTIWIGVMPTYQI